MVVDLVTRQCMVFSVMLQLYADTLFLFLGHLFIITCIGITIHVALIKPDCMKFLWDWWSKEMLIWLKLFNQKNINELRWYIPCGFWVCHCGKANNLLLTAEFAFLPKKNNSWVCILFKFLTILTFPTKCKFQYCPYISQENNLRLRHINFYHFHYHFYKFYYL